MEEENVVPTIANILPSVKKLYTRQYPHIGSLENELQMDKDSLKFHKNDGTFKFKIKGFNNDKVISQPLPPQIVNFFKKSDNKKGWSVKEGKEDELHKTIRDAFVWKISNTPRNPEQPEQPEQPPQPVVPAPQGQDNQALIQQLQDFQGALVNAMDTNRPPRLSSQDRQDLMRDFEPLISDFGEIPRIVSTSSSGDKGQVLLEVISADPKLSTRDKYEMSIDFTKQLADNPLQVGEIIKKGALAILNKRKLNRPQTGRVMSAKKKRDFLMKL